MNFNTNNQKEKLTYLYLKLTKNAGLGFIPLVSRLES